MYMQNAMWSLIDAITLFEQDFSLPNETGQLNAATLAGSGARMEVSSEDEKGVAPDGMEIESDHTRQKKTLQGGTRQKGTLQGRVEKAQKVCLRCTCMHACESSELLCCPLRVGLAFVCDGAAQVHDLFFLGARLMLLYLAGPRPEEADSEAAHPDWNRSARSPPSRDRQRARKRVDNG